MPTIPIRWADNTDQLRANLKEGLNQIEATKAAADRMTQSLGGSKLMAAAHNFAAAVQQIGGVEKLTNAERERGNALLDKAIEKYRVLGQTAPKALRDLAAATKQSSTQAFVLSDALASIGLSLGAGAGAAVGSGLVLGVRHALELSDALSKLSDRTGITATGLQRLDAIARPSGNTLEQIADGINRFQRNLIDGSGETASALGRIGLSFRELESLGADEQFIAIAKGIQSIKDPAEQAFVAMQLFGKAGAELLPSLKAKVDELADSTFKMSDRAVKAWDDVGDAVERWKVNTLNAIGEVAAAMISGASPTAGLVLGAGRTTSEALIPRTGPPPAPLSGERGNISLFAVPGLPDPATIASIERFSKALLKAAEAQIAAKGLADQWARIAKFEDMWGKLAAQPRQTFTPFSESLKDFAAFEIDLRDVGNLTTQTFDDMIQKAKELEDAFRKAFGVVADLSLGLPAGNSPLNKKAIDDARMGMDDLVDSTDQWQAGLQGVSELLHGIQDASIRTFQNMQQRVFAAIQGVIQLVQNFIRLKQAIDAANVSAQISNALGISLSILTIAMAFIAKGGVIGPHGVQRFASGGMAQPQFYARGTDTVPAMLTPGEMVLNAQQQARLFQIADGRRSGGAGTVVHNHWAGVIMTPDVYRDIARKTLTHSARAVARNTDSAASRGRAGYQLRS